MTYRFPTLGKAQAFQIRKAKENPQYVYTCFSRGYMTAPFYVDDNADKPKQLHEL